MNKMQKSKFSMKLAIRFFLRQNAPITSTIPHFEGVFNPLSDNMDLIEIIRELQEADKTGIALNKDKYRNDLCDKALDISRKTGVYAEMTQQLVLAREVYYSESDLRVAPDNLLKDRALLIHDKALAVLAELGPYGVTDRDLTALKSAIDLFNAYIPKPRLGITEKKQATDQLNHLFKSNDALLRKLDKLMELVRTSQPVFYAAYHNNRKVIETGRSYISLKATITDSGTKAGIQGVKVIFTGQNGNVKLLMAKGDKPLVKLTAEKGRFRIKSLPAGSYTAILNKPGYLEKVVTVTVTDNETTDLVVEMEKG